MKLTADEPTFADMTLDKTFVDKDESKTDKKAKGKGRRKELTEDEKKKQEEEKRKQEEDEKVKKMKEEEEIKRLDEPQPKELTDEEKAAYEAKLQLILELFTEINLRQINQKFEGEPQADNAQVDEQPGQNKPAENKDIKDIENVENEQPVAEAKEESKEIYFGGRILHEILQQPSFRKL